MAGRRLLITLLIAVVVAAAAAAVLYAPGRPPVYIHSATSISVTASVAEKTISHRVSVVDALGRRIVLESRPISIVVVDGGSGGYLVAILQLAKRAGVKVAAADLSDIEAHAPSVYRVLSGMLDGVVDVGTLASLKVDALRGRVVLAAWWTRPFLERYERESKIIYLDLYPGDSEAYTRSINALRAVFGTDGGLGRLLAGAYREVERSIHDLFPVNTSLYVEWLRGPWGRVARGAGIAVNTSSDPRVAILVYTGRFAAERLEALRNRLAGTMAARHYRICGVPAWAGDGLWSVYGLAALVQAAHPAAARSFGGVAGLARSASSLLGFNVSRLIEPRCLNPPRHRVVVTDVLGRRVVLTVPAERIAVMYGLEDLVAVGGEEALSKLVALNSFRYKKWRPDWWAAWTSHYPWLSRLPNTGQPGHGFNLEAILETHPDVVIAAAFMYRGMADSGALEKLEKAGIPVVFIDFVPHTTNVTLHLKAVRKSLQLLGVITGYEDVAEKLYRMYREKLYSILNISRSLPKTKTLVLATWSRWRAYGAKSMYQVWITFAGGSNIAAKVVPGSSGDINPEYILEANPQVIIFTCNNNVVTAEGVKQMQVIGYTVNTTKPAKRLLKMLIQRPGWSNLDAVKTGRIYLIHHGLSHGHIFQYIALEYIAKWLHPRAFSRLDPLADFHRFYREYMPFPLRGVWGVGINDP